MSKYEFVNPDSFNKAVTEIEQERVQKEIRDFFTFSADPEQTKVWQRYLEIEGKRQREELERQRTEQFWAYVFVACLASYMIYTLYQCLTYVPR